MRVAFLKGTGFVSRAIQIWTRSKYCHCELVFGDDLRFSADPTMPMHTRFSIEPMSASCWDFIEIPMDKEKEKIICEYFKTELDCRYDWVGIFLSQFIPFGYHSESKWFCSEVCVAGLQKVGLLTDVKPNRVSPGKLYKLLQK